MYSKDRKKMRLLKTPLQIGLAVFFFLGLVLTGCSERPKETDDERDKRYQRNYEQHFKMSICLSMEVGVEFYEKDPLDRTWGIQGYGSKEDVTNDLYAKGELMRSMTRTGASYYPKDFQPNPSLISIEAVNQYCPELASKFWRIPY